jgi:hypothetical protein
MICLTCKKEIRSMEKHKGHMTTMASSAAFMLVAMSRNKFCRLPGLYDIVAEVKRREKLIKVNAINRQEEVLGSCFYDFSGKLVKNEK